MALQEGSNAPDFTLPDGEDKPVGLAGFRGRPVVVYFYPKDDTSGCTAEAKDFTCLSEDFQNAGAAVIGISPDSPASHRKFVVKHDLNVQLLSDANHSVAEAYGVWLEKSMYGRKYMGVERATFLIDNAGMIARIWRKVRVPRHAEEVLEAVRAMNG